MFSIFYLKSQRRRLCFEVISVARQSPPTLTCLRVAHLYLLLSPAGGRQSCIASDSTKKKLPSPSRNILPASRNEKKTLYVSVWVSYIGSLIENGVYMGDLNMCTMMYFPRSRV